MTNTEGRNFLPLNLLSSPGLFDFLSEREVSNDGRRVVLPNDMRAERHNHQQTRQRKTEVDLQEIDCDEKLRNFLKLVDWKLSVLNVNHNENYAHLGRRIKKILYRFF